MNQSNELALLPSKNDLEVMQNVVKYCMESGLYTRIGTAPKIMAIALTARELGLPLMASLNGGINIIDGRPEISARMLNALILKSGGKIKVIKLDNSGCWLKGIRGDQEMEASFTMEEAKNAGLAGKKNWITYKQDMLWARALSRLARRLWADLIGAAYVEGELSGDEQVKPEIPPEQLPESNDVQVVSFSIIVEEFIESFGEDKDNMKEYMDYSIGWYKEKNKVDLAPEEFVRCFKEKREEKTGFFQRWKEKKGK